MDLLGVFQICCCSAVFYLIVRFGPAVSAWFCGTSGEE
jgi:hypothetical protein